MEVETAVGSRRGGCTSSVVGLLKYILNLYNVSLGLLYRDYFTSVALSVCPTTDFYQTIKQTRFDNLIKCISNDNCSYYSLIFNIYIIIILL